MYLFIATAIGRLPRKVEHLWKKWVVIMQNRICFSTLLASLIYENWTWIPFFCPVEFFESCVIILSVGIFICLITSIILQEFGCVLAIRKLQKEWKWDPLHFAFSYKQKTNKKQAVLGMKISSESPCPTLSEDLWTLWLLETVGHHLRAEDALKYTEPPSLPYLSIFVD